MRDKGAETADGRINGKGTLTERLVVGGGLGNERCGGVL